MVGAQLRSTQIHEDADGAPDGFCGTAYVARHRFPFRCTVMGAVDAGDIHACIDQLADQAIISGGLGWQRDHDAHCSSRRRLAEQGGGVLLQQFAAALDTDGFFCRMRLPGKRLEAMQDSEHLVEIGEHIRFGATKR
jgi:hypothetical protein